ncbi:single-stranded DNA-binding protein [Streptomyces sp. NPDC008092]|uniref:single-stranded DNA-binding protein n=1 Tax=Streptomyces sp. NPDC008092 TaxID=3364808 RepID=UPI0036E1E6B3
MSLPTLNGTARLIDTPELRFSGAGKAVVRVRLAFNARRKDDSGNWVDGDTFYIDGKAFDQHAERIAESLEKGMEVVVAGRLKTDQWTTREGEKRSGPSLLLDAIGPSLRYATAQVTKAGSGGGRQAYQEARQASSREGMDDPWGASPAAQGQAGGWGGGEDPPF